MQQHGERWLTRECDDVRFWGKPRKKPPEFCGEDGTTRMLRLADCECKVASLIEDTAQAEKVKGIAPKSPFQIGGAGAVGTGTLRGIPFLPRLQEGRIRHLAVRCAAAADAGRDLSAAVDRAGEEERAEERVRYLRERALRAVLTRAALAQAEESEDAFDAAVSAVRMGERRAEFTKLPRLTEEVRQLEGKVWGASG